MKVEMKRWLVRKLSGRLAKLEFVKLNKLKGFELIDWTVDTSQFYAK